MKSQDESEQSETNENGNDMEKIKENIDFELVKLVTIEKEQMTEIKEKCNIQAKRNLPGQPQDGEFPSSNLTRPTFTKVPKQSISSSKFPCFIPKSKPRSLKKVIHYLNQNHILSCLCYR